MAKIYKTDGSVETIKDLSLESLQQMVGGYIEIVSSPTYDFVCDEDGKLKKYRINAKATALAHENNAIAPTDVLVGDVIVAEIGEIE